MHPRRRENEKERNERGEKEIKCGRRKAKELRKEEREDIGNRWRGRGRKMEKNSERRKTFGDDELTNDARDKDGDAERSKHHDAYGDNRP